MPLPPPSRRIYLIAPSSAVSDEAAYRRGIQRLQAKGFEVLNPDKPLTRKDTRFAGNVSSRIDELHEAAQSQAHVALSVRGGYGLHRLLPQIDWSLLSTSSALWQGYSDFTALHMGIMAHCLAKTDSQPMLSPRLVAGPMLCVDFGVENPDETSLSEAYALFTHAARAHQKPWKLSWQGNFVAEEPTFSLQLNTKQDTKYKTLARGLLWGGNLAMLSSLAGTPYLPHFKTLPNILFVEDINEHPYRIERSLLHLFYSGYLQGCQAIICGQFTDYRLSAQDNGYTLPVALAYVQDTLHIPVYTGLPFGHVLQKRYLPLGVEVFLHADEATTHHE